MRESLAALLLILVLPLGCTALRHRPGVPASGIEPLREAAFDQFANQLTDAIGELVRQHDYRPPALIALPHVEPGGVEDGSVARGFAIRLAEGLNDRLNGSALFAKSSLVVPDLRCTLRFVANQDDPGRRTIDFRLLDYESGEELLAETYAYRAARAEVAARLVHPPTGGLEIDAPSGSIGELALRHAPAYRRRSIVGNLGRVVFLDRKAWERFWLQAQRAARTEDDRLRVELDVRARRRERDAELRVVFYDDQDNPVDVTPVLPYRFLPHYAKQVTVTSAKPGATHYICLFTYD